MKNNLKLNVDKQQDEIKHLKYQCNTDDKDKVQEISGAKMPMEKNKSACVTCNQIFFTNKFG